MSDETPDSEVSDPVDPDEAPDDDVTDPVDDD
jgi:hypothetical protein